MDILTFKDVFFSYELNAEPILKKVNANVKENTTAFIIGNSGGGKSTFLRLAAGLIVPDSGEVIICGINTRYASKPQLMEFHKRSAFVFQDSGLVSNLVLYDNLALPLRYHTRLTETQIKNKIDPVIEELGLTEHYNRLPGQMSRSERKLAGIARSVIVDPEIFFFDEPLAGLDYVAADKVKKIISRLAGTKTIIVTEQSLSFGMKIADLFICLVDGEIVYSGSPDGIQLSEHPFLKRLLESRKETTTFYTSLEKNIKE